MMTSGIDPAQCDTQNLFISIIVPTYNRLTFLMEALASIDFPDGDYEVIVVDDVSTDGTWEWLQGWEDGEKRIAIRMEQNSGPGAARNCGAKVARGRYLAFLDSDDQWFPHSLGAIRRAIGGQVDPAVLIHGCVEFRSNDLGRLSTGELKVREYPDVLTGLAHGGFFVGAAACIIRTGLFLKSGGFTYKRMNSEDHDLLLKLACSGPMMVIETPPIFAYRRHEESLVSNSVLSFRGYRHLISSERNGLYPGGKKRRTERLVVLTRILRPAILELMSKRYYSKALALYRRSFWWNLRELRLRFLLGAWLHAMVSRRRVQ